jgi:hypothetical protein
LRWGAETGCLPNPKRVLKNLAAIYSVLGTCELNGINPYVYLCDLLEKLPARNSNDIDDLLPMNWKPSESK